MTTWENSSVGKHTHTHTHTHAHSKRKLRPVCDDISPIERSSPPASKQVSAYQCSNKLRPVTFCSACSSWVSNFAKPLVHACQNVLVAEIVALRSVPLQRIKPITSNRSSASSTAKTSWTISIKFRRSSTLTLVAHSVSLKPQQTHFADTATLIQNRPRPIFPYFFPIYDLQSSCHSILCGLCSS